MTCAEFQEILHDLDRPGTQGLAKRESALAHAESCSSCGRLLTEAEALDFGLHTLAMQSDAARAPVRIEAALISEFRRHAAPARQNARWYAAVAAVAAVGLLAVALMRVRNGIEPRSQADKNAAAGKIVTDAAGNTSRPHSAAASEVNEGLNELASAEEGTDFVRLPYADDSATLEGGAVIRVAVPRATLASWGLPVAAVGSTERIPAELVVSADGMPQAIRLISQEAE